MTVAVVYHPRRKSFHASLNCAYGRTAATDETLTVCTEQMARAEGRRQCPRCWSPEGYIVRPDYIHQALLRQTA